MVMVNVRRPWGAHYGALHPLQSPLTGPCLLSPSCSVLLPRRASLTFICFFPWKSSGGGGVLCPEPHPPLLFQC